jgi:hypothetical protein
MEVSLFDEVADALRGMVPPALGSLQLRPRRYGIKVWFGGEAAPREHYEAQVIGPASVPEANVLALEVGFHAEHPKPVDSDAAIGRLMARESRWRRALGPEAEAGAFLGRQQAWRRVSETWADPDLADPGLAVEIAARLTDYVTALEPHRRRPA